MKLIYVCLPYKSNPVKSKADAIKICKIISDAGNLPIAPQIYLEQFMEEKNRKEVMAKCIKLLSLCDEITVGGWELSSGMKQELEWWINHKPKGFITILINSTEQAVVRHILDLIEPEEDDGA